MDLDVQIGVGAQAKVYLWDNYAVKVFRQGYNKSDVFYEAMITSMIEKIGILVTIKV